jgi:hypothetical protein
MSSMNYAAIEALDKQARRERSQEVHRLLLCLVAWSRLLLSPRRAPLQTAPCC